MAETLIDLWRLPSTDADRLRRIAADSGIDRRATVIPLAEVLPLTTHRRMEAYERLAPPLAIEAARNALGAAGVDATAITDVVVVSCTGFSAPGIDTELVTALGLPRTVRRTVVGFMGCYGAIIGLRTAAAACAASPGSVALVVCAELCSLHLQPDPSQESQVAAMLFADGAAAAVVSSGRSDTRISPGGSLLLEEAHEWMSWRITDAGFALTLSKCVPVALRRHLAAFV
jgi:predicted naringenin-chalcone synthase